ncbi:acid phosphatase [Duganella levis]|uniref:Acid phosphatase n=1 Tax=Duganella levis TaxID=2692169 RepID=A0ABW9W4Q1_9BURK|nr:phosphatase PAP2 family protein [Duganella levis]MYN28723.1 phosphatase PAP2 family protein [Duganella levis]
MKMLAVPAVILAALCITNVSAREAYFVGADQTRPDLIPKAPAAPGTAESNAELAELHRIQAARTPAQAAQAMSDAKNETMFLYADVLGPRFAPATLPLTAALADHVKNDHGANAGPAKQYFHRMRPYNLDTTLHAICGAKSSDDSYPSGHATAGYMAGLVLIEMVPEQRDAILARADDYARQRLVCGVHYRSDIEASKVLAYAAHALMDANPAFKAERDAATAELRQALGLPQLRP